MAALVINLAACTGTNANVPAGPEASAAPAATAAPAPAKQNRVYPSPGYPNGVIASGVSIADDPAGNGLRYSCDDSLAKVDVNMYAGVQYYDTVINVGELVTNDEAQRQLAAVVGFLQPENFFPIALIVHSADDTKHDERVVTLTDSVIAAGPLVLRNTDFAPGGKITGVTVCSAAGA
jgi:hypothetical protein